MHNLDPIRDLFNQIIELYDIIVVISANGKMDLAMVTDLAVVNNKYFIPIIQRFNKDLTLREGKFPFVHCETKSFLLQQGSIPVEAWDVRLKLIEVHNGY